MKFKTYLKTQNISEGIIVPDKIKINSKDANDIKKLNKQFKDTVISFEMSNGGAHAAYVPELDEIIVYLDKDGEMDAGTLETLIQHELIHLTQDQKSGMRMGPTIQKDYEKLRAMNKEVQKCGEDEEICPNLIKDYRELVAKMDYLNPEEEMAYAFMYAKMYRKLKMKEVLKKMFNEWKEWTSKKPSKRMLKYFYSYWMIKDEL